MGLHGRVAHFMTRMLEEGNDPETVRAIAGHIRPEMTKYYSHQRKRVKYEAVKKIYHLQTLRRARNRRREQRFMKAPAL